MCKVPDIPSICKKWSGGKHSQQENVTWRKRNLIQSAMRRSRRTRHCRFSFRARDLRPNDILMEVLYTGLSSRYCDVFGLSESVLKRPADKLGPVP
jgi:hypothetical protein